jgi:protein-disulfide isomerase
MIVRVHRSRHWHAIHPRTKCPVSRTRTRAPFWSTLLNVVRYALIASSIALSALAPPLAGTAAAQSAIAAAVAKPVELPDITIGSAKAPITITEYASMSCPHCAAFGENVFPMLRSKYIDTGKVRFVFREFPLDIKAAAASMLARCIGKDDPEKYLGAVEILFKQQESLMVQTKDTLKAIGRLNGMSEQEVETCAKDQTMLDKLAADQRYAFEILKVDSTPYFFVNGERLKGAMSFEELEERIKPLLKK